MITGENQLCQRCVHNLIACLQLSEAMPSGCSVEHKLCIGIQTVWNKADHHLESSCSMYMYMHVRYCFVRNITLASEVLHKIYTVLVIYCASKLH